jgi:ectoine hydroxylase-related dioxygenase (phytanoyl-CoA dioxygenase family)
MYKTNVKEDSRMIGSIPLNIQEALQQLGAHENLLTEEEKRSFYEKGYVLFHNIMDPAWLKELKDTFEHLIAKEGPSAGKEVHQEKGARRLADLVNKSTAFDRMYTHPKVLAAVYHIMQAEFKLNSLNGRDSIPGEGLQGLHADWGPRIPEEPYTNANSIWMIDDFTEQNGATRVVPGTHKWKGLPADYMESTNDSHPEEVLLLAPAGSVGVFNGHVWHGGTLNKSKGNRMAYHCAFIGREYDPQTNQRDYIRKLTYDRISPAARYMLDV